MKPTKLLVFANGVSMAHASRALNLVSSLNQAEFDISYATESQFLKILNPQGMRLFALPTLSSSQFNHRISRSLPIFTKDELGREIEDDLALIRAVNPDIILGDFRLSLSVSARISQIPYINLTNSHWSPFSKGLYVVPEHPLFKWLGPRLATWVHSRILTQKRLEKLMGSHLNPINYHRKKNNLPPLKSLYQVYTDGDYVFYLEPSPFIPLKGLPENHTKIGAISWSPNFQWTQPRSFLKPSSTKIFISMGTTGNPTILDKLLKVLVPLNFSIIVATSGRKHITVHNPNIHFYDYVSGDKACEQSDLVICNGGSAMAYLALSKGTPVLGITSNTDQVLTMSYLEEFGVGKLVRDWQFSGESFLAKSMKLLHNRSVMDKVKELEREFDFTNTQQNFVKTLRSLAGKNNHKRAHLCAL